MVIIIMANTLIFLCAKYSCIFVIHINTFNPKNKPTI